MVQQRTTSSCWTHCWSNNWFFWINWNWRRIILSPLIVLFKWGNIKEAAAVSALFIFVNSAAGISGQLINNAQISPTIPILIFVVLIGGFIGSFLGSKKTSSTALKFLLCLVLLFASVKLLIV